MQQDDIYEHCATKHMRRCEAPSEHHAIEREALSLGLIETILG